MTKPVVGFIFAMEEEMNPYREILEKEQKFDSEIFLSGIGRTNAGIMTLLASLKCDIIVNIGTCGSTVDSVRSWFVPERFYDGDFDLSVFGNNTSDPCRVNDKEVGGVELWTYSHFVIDSPSNRLVDMEAYPIVALCKRLSKPFRIYKVVSDSADGSDVENFDEVAEKVSEGTAESIIKDLNNYIGGLFNV